MRNKQWQKHRKKDQTTANQMTVYVCFFNEVGTAVWPREFYHGNFLLCFKSKFSKANSRGKIPVVIPRFLLRKKKNTVNRFAVVWSLVWCFCYCLFLIGNFVMVDSPRFPKSSGIDPKKALQNSTGQI